MIFEMRLHTTSGIVRKSRRGDRALTNAQSVPLGAFFQTESGPLNRSSTLAMDDSSTYPGAFAVDPELPPKTRNSIVRWKADR